MFDKTEGPLLSNYQFLMKINLKKTEQYDPIPNKR